MAFSFSQPPFQQSTPNPFQPQPQPQTLQPPQFQFQPQQPQFQVQPQQQSPLQMQPPQLQLQPQLLQQQQQQPKTQQPTILLKVDRTPATYSTKWEELHPDSQKYLLQIEERILEYRSESQRLDQCNRLYDSSVANNGFELDATRIIQELGGISITMDREKILAQELMTSAKDMMRNTEFAVRTFIILRPRFFHPSSAVTSNVSTGSQTSGATAASSSTIQPTTSPLQTFDFYSGVPKRPSPFFVQTVTEFEKYLAECRQWIEDLEQLLHVDTKNTLSTSGISLECLPSVLSNVYDYFVYVAAKVENLHQYIESMKTAYLADQRQRGDGNDPFLEADRRETAKLEAAARRVHPTLHLPAVSSQPSSQNAGLFFSSGMPGASVVSHQPLGGSSGGSSGSGFLTLSTPSTSAAASTLFSTPSSSAPASTLFSSSGFSPQSTASGPAQTPLFGVSTPAATSIPAIGSSPLFSTPSFGPGPTMGSGASFGATSKSSKPRSRAPTRR
uniref:Nucleoporin p58/p45 n=1 Tax=Anthurium amnicola TaxID=1678845 RepID=A0A1D1ZGL3_9ARAE